MFSVAASFDVATSFRELHCTSSDSVPVQALVRPRCFAAPVQRFCTTVRQCQLLTRRRRAPIVCSVKDRGTDQRTSAQIDSQAKIRSEVIAPFRTLRIFFYLAFMASAGLGGAIALTRVIGAVGGAPNADPLPEALQNLGIDAAAFGILAFLWVRDTAAEKKSIARITREETLSGLRIELSNKRVVSVAQMRGTCRLLVLAGNRDHIQSALEKAQPFKQALVERGVLLVPLYRDGAGPSKTPGGGGMGEGGRAVGGVGGVETGGDVSGIEGLIVDAATSADLDKRFIATPIYTNEWTKWLGEQMKLANVSEDKPIYISLRLDGRVRASGVGFPPFQIISAQLPPLKGIWAGPLDGMDGWV